MYDKKPFEVLGIPACSGELEVRSAYRALVKTCHPDQYQDEEQRLCVNYLLDEQTITGQGLIVLALVVGGLALARLVAASRRAADNHPAERLVRDAEAGSRGMMRR